MGPNPKMPLIWLNIAVSCPPNAYLKNIPATITEVKAGMNNADLKILRPRNNLLFNNTASTNGNGINIAMVKNVYVKLAFNAV
jgi:hypothetical protein